MKNYCIIGPMRSGTTMLFRMVRDFSKDFDSKLNDEFFNTLLPNFGIEDTGTELVNTDRPYLSHNLEIDYRISLLKKYNCKYTIKVVADQLDQSILNFLIENYKIILIDRKNKYEQYLSLLIAEHSNVWNRGREFKEFLNPFVASTDVANEFFLFEKKWKNNKKFIFKNTAPVILWYEDFVLNPLPQLAQLGIQIFPFSKYYKPLFKMRDQKQKERLIINIDKINDIYYNNINANTI